MLDRFEIVTGTIGPRVAVLRVSGRLDARTALELGARCAAALPPGGHLVLNLAEVTFLSSSGIGTLIVASERAREQGGSLRLGPVSAAVRSSLAVLNLDRYLAMDESEEASLAEVERAA
jgi:anti-anti-sigma factor